MATLLLQFFLFYMFFHNTQATLCSGGLVWQPSSGTAFYWNLHPDISTNTILTNDYAQAYDLDLFYVTPAIVDLIHSLNRTLICYIDTSYEPYRPDAYKFIESILGNDLEGWPGQRWTDIQSSVLREIMADRLQMAVRLGCDAIEWDDVDAYANNNGLNLGPNDQLNFNLFLANITHTAGLSVGLKNDVNQIDVLHDYFDWALNEQCTEYEECHKLLPFVDQNKAVFGAEYNGNSLKCLALNDMGFSFIHTNIELDGKTLLPCCGFNTPACALQQYRCVVPPRSYPSFQDDVGSGAARVCFSLSVVVATFLVGLLLF